MSGGRIEPNRPEVITLEDLESFSEDQLSDSGNGSLEEEAETMEEDDERLLRYWQDVARGHQVEVSPGKNVKNDEELVRRNLFVSMNILRVCSLSVQHSH